MAELLAGKNRPTAVICDDDLLAPLVDRGARQAGLRIPQDMSVVGIGDIDLAALLDPPLTTVAIPQPAPSAGPPLAHCCARSKASGRKPLS